MNRWLRATVAAGAALGVPALVNAVVQARAAAPASALGGEERYFTWRHGDIFYSTAGEGSPLLLVHGIGAGASSYEWQHNFLELSESFRVYALDLLGFGLSDRPPVRYHARLYVDLLHDFIEQVIGEPVNAIGSSLSCAYLVDNAAHSPQHFLRLMLACPAGVTSLAGRPGFRGSLAVSMFRLPVLGQTAYNLLASHRAVRHELRERLFADPDRVTPAMVRHYYRASHLPGSVGPVAAFIGGYLNLDVSEAFATLELPVRLVWGAEATYTPVEEAQVWLDLNPRAELTVIGNAGMLPHSEQPLEFNRLVEEQLAASA